MKADCWLGPGSGRTPAIDENVDISVVIPTYNRAPILSRTLAALADQRPPLEHPANSMPRYEVIVIDDGSDDDTAGVCQSASARMAHLHYHRQENRKQGAARNLGSQQAAGRLLVFLGDDTVPVPEFLYQHHLAHQAGDEALAVIGYTPWAREYRVTRFMKYIGEQGWQFGFSLIDEPDDVPFNFFYTSNLSLDRSFFLSSGGFDEDFQEYGWEDIELSLRLKKRGMRIAYHPTAVAHHHHPTSLATFLKRQRRVGFSAWTFYKKHPEMGEFLNTRSLPACSLRRRLKMRLLGLLCIVTERLAWPDLSGYYPDLLSYHYNLGLLEACNE